MTSLNEKIREILTVYKLSGRQFAIKIGVSQSVIGSMFQNGTEPSAKVIRNTLIAFPEISADWFLRDVGEIKVNTQKETERLNAMLDTITLLQGTINAKDEAIKALMKRVEELEAKH